METLTGKKRGVLLVLLVLATLCFFIGITQPIMRLPRYHIWATQYSLVEMVQALWLQNQHFMAANIFVGAVVLKFVLLYLLFMQVWTGGRSSVKTARFFTVLEFFAGWAMADVLLLALAIFLAKQQSAFSPDLVLGLSALSLSVVCMWVVSRYTNTHHVRTASRRAQMVAWWALLASIFTGVVTLYYGLSEPIVRFTALAWFENEYSVTGLADTLHKKGYIALYWVLVTFSVIFPTAKLGVLMMCFAFWHILGTHVSVVKMIEWFGRYSMTDIYVLALMVFYMNGSGYTESIVLHGTYYFTASVASAMVGFIAAEILLRPRRFGLVNSLRKETVHA